MQSNKIGKRCSVCHETMKGSDYGLDGVSSIVGISIAFRGKTEGLKLRRHKGNNWTVCYDCWLYSLGIKN